MTDIDELPELPELTGLFEALGPPGTEARLPGWCLAELSPKGRPTGRVLDALHEDLDEVEPQGQSGGIA